MYRQLGSRALIVLAAFYCVGCATLTVNVDPSAREAGVRAGSQVILKGNTDGLQVFQDGSSEPMKIVSVENPNWKTAVGNATRQSVAENSGAATYTRKMQYSPAIYLNQKHTHTLRLVRSDGSQAVVVQKPHVGMRYVVVDWLLFAPTLGTSLIIDWSTGKWKSFDAIDVGTVFPSVSKSGSMK